MENMSGMVFTMTNSSKGNEIIAFRRNKDGILNRMKSYPTGGRGTGNQKVDPLSSQGSVILSPNGNMLFNVNAGSNSISSFRVSAQGELSLKAVTHSNGTMPNSLSALSNVLFVTNRGNAARQATSNLVGFTINHDGSLTRIMGATKFLSSPTAVPACIIFNAKENTLVVSELSTDKLSVYPVNENGIPEQAYVNSSSGSGPFGSAQLSNGFLLVAEADTNALSSYRCMTNGRLAVVNGSVPNGQSATCWVSVDNSEEFAYTSNAGSNTITSYHIGQNGTLKVRRNFYSNPDKNAVPTDSGISRDGRNLYVLNGNGGTISVFAIIKHGEISPVQEMTDTGLPKSGIQGLAVL